jgi:hypothetical protein
MINPTLVKRGNGFTSFHIGVGSFQDQEILRDHVCVLLAGVIAEEVGGVLQVSGDALAITKQERLVV